MQENVRVGVHEARKHDFAPEINVWRGDMAWKGAFAAVYFCDKTCSW